MMQESKQTALQLQASADQLQAEVWVLNQAVDAFRTEVTVRQEVRFALFKQLLLDSLSPEEQERLSLRQRGRALEQAP